MRRRITAALVSLLALSSCLPHEPTGTEGRADQARLLVRADLTGTAIAMVVVEVRAPDIPVPLVFNIPTVNALASGTISVLAGSNRTITVRAYDAGGVQTHTGSVTLSIQPGTNPAISIVLMPLAGNLPVTVTLGSFSVTVRPAVDSLLPGDTVKLTATVLDANNAPVSGQVVWATLAPGVATVVSTGQQTGRVTGMGLGSTTVVAVYGGIAASATITAHTTGGIFPLHVEAGKRYLVDAKGNPFLLQGDAAWSLIAQLTNEEANQYLEDRRLKGFNTVIVNLIEHHFSTNPPSDVYGDAPFLTPGDFSTPNEAYFAHAQYVINLAAQKGILVLLFPAYMGVDGGPEGWYQEMAANGPTKLGNYGTYVANRFRAYDNILWGQGGDYNPPDLNILRAIPNAIRAVDPKWPQTFGGSAGTSALGFLGTAEPWLQVNDVYTYNDLVDHAFQEYTRSSMPFFLIESTYENNNGATEVTVRQQAYQAVLSGGTGQIMGNTPVWLFGSGWQAALNSPGARTLSYLPALLAGRAWWTLVPDITHTVLTAGISAGSDYSATARATDGSFVLAYLPSARSVTVDLAQLSGPNVVARWYDPANGTYATIAGSPFAASGAHVFPSAGVNSSGFSDWVLVLESSP
jgi:hypothetical protein